MYYAITIKDNTITGVHESVTPITDKTFAKNPELSAQEVVPVNDAAEYQSGRNLAEYTGGVLRPIVDRINESLSDIPDGYELIDGALVKINVPVTEAPPSIAETIRQLKADNMDIVTQLANIAQSPSLSLSIGGITESVKQLVADNEALKADNEALKIRLADMDKKNVVFAEDIVTLKGGKVDKPV